MTRPRALIAEDEPLLAQALQQQLARQWPGLDVLPSAANGVAALEQALALQPDVLFLDIKMPGKTGLEVARDLAEEWPEQRAFPLIVFVTAYDNYAIDAFEQAAVDYLLKPVDPERLRTSVLRLKALLEQRAHAGPQQHLEQMLGQLRQLPLEPSTFPTRPSAAPLKIIRAAVGNQVRLIPVEDVLYFEATDKYVNVVTADGESLIRTSLKELLPQLDADKFWQIHRGTVVQIRQVHAAVRDDGGKLSLILRGRPEKLAVSRLYTPLFKQM